jgi:Ca2+-binding EF-hand superfamily protein
MTPLGLLVLALAVAPAPADDAPIAVPGPAAFDALGDDAVRDLVILGDARPILLRVRVMVGGRSIRSAWLEGIRDLHSRLDRDGDGRVTVAEAEKGGAVAPTAPPGAATASRGQAGIDVNPKDGVVSVEELAEARRAASGPFRLRVDSPTDRRTDALFDQLDRDKDGQLTRSEMEAIVGSLRRLDRDADELIGVDEAELVAAPIAAAASMTQGRPSRDPAVPTVLEIAAGESQVRLARLLIKKYDAGSSRGPGRRDSRLTREEFAIPAGAFAAADANRDGTLNAEELRAYLAGAPRDAILDVSLSGDASGRAAAVIRGIGGGSPPGMAVRQLSGSAMVIDLDLLRLDIQVDDGAGAAEAARREFRTRFEAADANQDGYLEVDELGQDIGQPSPFAGLFKTLDRDGDGKLYPRELDEYVSAQAAAARGRAVMTASDEGRALFGLLDMDRDRRLGAREVLETFARISACDRNADGTVTVDEIPHHIRITLARGDLSDLLATSPAGQPVAASPGVAASPTHTRPAAGPGWFRKMDSNRDGDVSPREFLGSREQFDRLDRDHDGLLSPDEAKAATPGGAVRVKAPGG